MLPALPDTWPASLHAETAQPYFARLAAFVGAEQQAAMVYPAAANIFQALQLTPWSETKAVILGQDPYHGPGQAHGLAFSVLPGVPPPPSLVNIFKERQSDLGLPVPPHGYLRHWAQQGVLLLNAVLTVRAGEPNSHAGRGWEQFTDAVLRCVAERPEPVVVVLWGNYAQKKAALFAGTHHAVLTAAHPSPLSARRGFFGSRPFSGINALLRAAGTQEIDWHLPPA